MSPDRDLDEVRDPNQVRAYSYDQVRNATNNFANEIGSGGFGHVYRGTLGDDAVAVKVSKTYTRLDFRQFESEVFKSLSPLRLQLNSDLQEKMRNDAISTN